ncbi:hypothetical protein, partial [cf. Phormidesmis sp. LEGE 11477]|uniref:hypothetical protein n=1 Tax=cf. Phormidesmis sp. LEGE 11477 TaxID=1828680 RepID=UPI00187F4805
LLGFFAAVVALVFAFGVGAVWRLERSEKRREQDETPEKYMSRMDRQNAFTEGLNSGAAVGFFLGPLLGWWAHEFAMEMRWL